MAAQVSRKGLCNTPTLALGGVGGVGGVGVHTSTGFIAVLVKAHRTNPLQGYLVRNTVSVHGRQGWPGGHLFARHVGHRHVGKALHIWCVVHKKNDQAGQARKSWLDAPACTPRPPPHWL